MAKPQSETNEPPADDTTLVGRLKLAYGVSTLAALADAMEQGSSTVKNWHYRGSVKLEHLVQAAKDTKRSLDWLAMGQESLSVAPTSRNLDFAMTGGEGRVTVAEAKEPAGAWRNAPPGGDSPLGGQTVANRRDGGRKSRSGGAVLPATDAGNAKPLVLSISGQQAGAQVEYYVIPKVLGGAGAGRGGDTPAAEVEMDLAGEFAMSARWLYANLRHTSGELASVQVVGDSMSPTLLDGETIIIDRAVREVTVDDIYVVHVLGRRLVKRVQRRLDGSLIIISDNRNYDRETVPRGSVPDLKVLGRMVWPRAR